jgi:hypothetical protein
VASTVTIKITSATVDRTSAVMAGARGTVAVEVALAIVIFDGNSTINKL